jgi:hypothetical protein
LDVLTNLERRARTIAEADTQAQQQIIEDVRTYLAATAAKGLLLRDIILATSTAWRIDNSGDRELAAEAFRKFAEVTGKSRDEKLRNLAKRWEEIASRVDSSAK